MANQSVLNTWNGIWSRISSLIGGNATAESPFGAGPVVIDQDTTFYIDTAGTEAGDGSYARPWRTFQQAINFLRNFEIRAAVTVQVGVGTFDGFVIDGLKIVNNAISTSGFTSALTFKGTFGTATGLVSGSATGTVTTSSAGVLNDTGQTWTVDDLKGRFVRFSTATATVEQMIGANTATQLSLVGGSTPLAASNYEIIEHKTVILPNVQASTGTLKYGTIFTGGDTGSGVNTSNPGLIFSCLKYTSAGISTSGSHVFALGAGARGLFSLCHFELDTTGTMTTAVSAAAPSAALYFSDTLFKTNKASTSFVVLNRDTKIQYLRIFMLGSAVASQQGFVQSGNGNGIVQSFSASLFESMGVVFASGTGSAVPFWTVMGSFINNVTVSNVYGDMYIVDSKGNLSSFPFTSAGNTNFVVARGGSRIGVNSNIPSGLATNDITMSTTGTISTLAAMRALTPQVLSDTLGTLVGSQGVVF